MGHSLVAVIRRCRRPIFGFIDFEHVHCAFRQTLLIGGACVCFRHFQRIPTEYRHKLMRRGAIVSGDGRASFAQAVCCAMAKSRLVAPISKLVSETQHP